MTLHKGLVPKHVNRAKREQLARENPVILEMAQRGATAKQIGKRLGLTDKAVHWRIRVFRKAGLLGPVKERRGPELIDSRTWATVTKRRLGTLPDILKKLDQNQLAWLAQQGPKGAETHEYVLSLILAAYEQDTSRTGSG